MEDSGEREVFATGAVRDTAEGKPAIHLISPFALIRLGNWLAEGAKKYDSRNWEQGMSFQRVTSSLCRHLEEWKAGYIKEDHLAAIMCNAMFLIHYQTMVDNGCLPETLNDMPIYKKLGEKK